MKKREMGLVAVLAMLAFGLCGSRAYGAPIILGDPMVWADGSGGIHNFNSGDASYGPWTLQNISGDGTMSQDALVGGETGLRGDNGTGIPPEETRYYNDKAAYTGDFTSPNEQRSDPVMSIRFNVYANAAAVNDPSDTFAMQLYFIGNGNTWYYDITPVADTWTMVLANLRYINTGLEPSANGFYSGILGEGDFLNDITSISQIGLQVSWAYPNAASQVIGLDDFTLDAQEFAVPEPHQGIMLAAALLSVGIVLRRRMPVLLGATAGK